MLNVFFLSPGEAEALMRPCNGGAGLQHYVRQLQGKLEWDGRIALTDGEVGRVYRYAGYANGKGGAERQLIEAFGRSMRETFPCLPN